MTKEKIIYPIRINRYLAKIGVASRREADDLIGRKLVRINDRAAVVGDKISEGDKVEVLPARETKKMIYLAYNKPRGIVTVGAQNGEKGIGDIYSFDQRIYPVGRLDKNSTGLIILTNDGRITDRILNPDRAHEKEYIVTVDRNITPAFIRAMGEGVILDDGYETKKCKVEKINSLSFSITLTEGKKHQIKRMCDKLERTVTDLERVRIMNIKLGNLKPGRGREIKGKELDVFLSSIGLK